MAPSSDLHPAERVSRSIRLGRIWAQTQVRSASSATAATASASGFVILVTLLSFVPDQPQDHAPTRAPDQTAAWQLRGTLPPSGGEPAPFRAQVAAPRVGNDV